METFPFLVLSLVHSRTAQLTDATTPVIPRPPVVLSPCNFRFASVEEKEVIISECWPVPRHC
jgi:hypothetical protein